MSYLNLELCVLRLLVMTITCQTKHALIICFKSLTCHYLHFIRPQSGAEAVSMTLLSLDELQGFMQQLQNLPCVVREAELVQVSLAQALKRLVCGLGDRKEQPKEYSSVTLNYKNKDQFSFQQALFKFSHTVTVFRFFLSLQKELMTRVESFQCEAQKVIQRSNTDVTRLQQLLDNGHSLDVDLPEIPKLKQVRIT